MIPEVTGEIAKVSPEPPGVPPVAENAVEDAALPAVVVMLLPPETEIGALTKMEYEEAEVVAPAESVTTIVFV